MCERMVYILSAVTVVCLSTIYRPPLLTCLVNTMAVREVLPRDYDELDQKLEKELPLSICGLVHFRLMRSKHLLREKMVLVDSWPDFSVLVIVDRQRREIFPIAVCFCRGPEFVSTLDTMLHSAWGELSSPMFAVGSSCDVNDALVNQYKSETSCPFRQNHDKAVVYTLPADSSVPIPMPDGFRETELSERHLDVLCKTWPYSKSNEFSSTERWLKYHICNFPTVCIETDDGCPVAWELQQEYGSVGMLHVEPEYRRKKLGSIVSRTLANKLNKGGHLVLALVTENNDPSVKFHEKNGYVRLPFKISFLGCFFETKQ